MEVEIEWDYDIFLDKFRPLADSDADIFLLYGGRDSGKSKYVAQQGLKDCLELPSGHFKGVLARKTFNSIRGSQYAMVKAEIHKQGLQSFFKFKDNSCEIDCYNGNQFISRGCDNPDNIKSLVDPTWLWIEEGNQITLNDYITLYTTLRHNEARIKQYITLNPEPEKQTNYKEFWVYEMFFKGETQASFTKLIKISVEINGKDVEVVKKVVVVHSCYKDNPHCPPSRAAEYELLKRISPYHYQTKTLGKWANRENKSPAIYTFRREATAERPSHIGDTELNRKWPVVQAWDINHNPMCCNIIQYQGNVVRWIDIIKLPNSSTEEMCERIAVKYPNVMWLVCGDWYGTHRDPLIKNKDLNTHYKIVRNYFKLTPGQMKQQPNPKVEDNLVLMNFFFEHVDILIDEQRCQPLINDIEFAEVLADGSLKKGDREDTNQQLDAFDGARYFINRFFPHLNTMKKP